MSLALIALQGGTQAMDLPAGAYAATTPNSLHTIHMISGGWHADGVPASPLQPAGYNETYGYPDGIGGLIVEGPFPCECPLRAPNLLLFLL